MGRVLRQNHTLTHRTTAHLEMGSVAKAAWQQEGRTGLDQPALGGGDGNCSHQGSVGCSGVCGGQRGRVRLRGRVWWCCWAHFSLGVSGSAVFQVKIETECLPCLLCGGHLVAP